MCSNPRNRQGRVAQPSGCAFYLFFLVRLEIQTDDRPSSQRYNSPKSLRRIPMKTPRKIIVYIATSADGYIARPDGDVAWLDRPRLKGNYGMSAFFKSIDTILWGRKTYA